MIEQARRIRYRSIEAEDSSEISLPHAKHWQQGASTQNSKRGHLG
jgi:hypothetical protein